MITRTTYARVAAALSIFAVLWCFTPPAEPSLSALRIPLAYRQGLPAMRAYACSFRSRKGTLESGNPI